jgi:hypothetical protein
MPVQYAARHDYFSQTPDLPNLVKYQRLFTQGVGTEGTLRLLPKYEKMLKEKLSKIGVTIELIKNPESTWNTASYTIYKNSQPIGQLDFHVSMIGFYFNTYTDYLRISKIASPSNPKAIAIRPVGKALDEFAQELNDMVAGELIRPAIENKASVNALKDATGNPDLARNIGKMSGIVPNVKGVDIGQGRRKRKTRKHRSRKHKKTRKH